MPFEIRFSEVKNQILKAMRGISLEEIRDAIVAGDLLADNAHTDAKRGHQRVYVVRIKDYAYAVPYVIDEEKRHIYLKTAYPSRTLTKRYLKRRKL